MPSKSAPDLRTAPTFAGTPLASNNLVPHSVSASCALSEIPAVTYAPGPLIFADELLPMLGYKHVVSLRQLSDRCGFPRSFSVGPCKADGRAGKIAWSRAEVLAWIEQRIAEARRPAHPMRNAKEHAEA